MSVFVQPSRASSSAAVTAAEWNPNADFYQVLTNASGAQAWPITGGVFVLISKARGNAAETKDALAFFSWALSEGQGDAAAGHYVALPDSLVRHVEAYWKTALP